MSLAPARRNETSYRSMISLKKPAKICSKTSVEESFGSLADKNRTRAKSLIQQKIEQVTLYKT